MLIRVLGAAVPLAVVLMHTPVAAAPIPAAAALAGAPEPVDTLFLRGVVLDAATGDPLPASVVRLVELDRQDITHDDGSFHLRRLPAGRYTLVVERLGYRTESREVRVSRSTPEPLEVRLGTSALDLPGLVVTATVGTSTREDAHRLTRVMSGRELQQQLETTLGATLESQPGLASGSMGPGTAKPVIRGLGGDRILVLEDGERVGDASAASPDHAMAVEAASAERIEVVRGPAALFYGSSALGGVVNVVREEIPSSLPDHPIGSLLVQGQSVNRGGTVSGSYSRAVGKLGLRAELTGRETGDVLTPEGPLHNSSLRTLSGAGGAAWVEGFGHAGASLRLYRSEYGIPPVPGGDADHDHGHDVRVEMERDALRGEARVSQLGDIGPLTVTAGYTRYDHREIEDDEVATAFGLDTGSGEVVLRHDRLGPLTGGGIGVRGQWQDYESYNGRTGVRAEELGGAIYFMEELEAGPLRFQAGARVDVLKVTPHAVEQVLGVPARERTFRNVSGSAAALWEPAPGWRLGLSVARAFRAPSAEELFSQGPHLAAYSYDVGNPELDAETGLGIDAFLRLERTRIAAEAGLFWTRVRDYSQPLNTGEQRDDFYVYRYLNTDARFHGAEASLRWAVVDPLVLQGDISWVRGRNLDLEQPLPLVPPVNGGLALRYDRDRWLAEIAWRGATRQDRVPAPPQLPDGSPPYCPATAGPDADPDAGDPVTCRPVPAESLPTDGYGVIDTSIGYRWFPGHQVHSVTLRVENLTDELYRNHLSRIKTFSPEPGIGVTLTYRASF